MRIEQFPASGGARIVIDDRTLADAISENVARLRAEYDAQIARGVVHRTKVLQIDDASRALLTAAIAQASAGIPLSAKFRGWRMADNTFLPMTAEQLKSLAQAASDHVLALRDALWTAVDAVRAAKTVAEADAVRAVWPV